MIAPIVGLAELLLVFRPNVGDETPFPAVTRDAIRGFVEPAWALRHAAHLPPEYERMFATVKAAGQVSAG